MFDSDTILCIALDIRGRPTNPKTLLNFTFAGGYNNKQT